MDWRLVSAIQRTCAAAPMGDRLYRRLRRRLGCAPAGQLARMRDAASLARWLVDAGVRLHGARVVEVGPGQPSGIPVIFWMCAAAKVVTLERAGANAAADADLPRCILAARAELHEITRGLTTLGRFHTAMVDAQAHLSSPDMFPRAVGMERKAPVDPAHTDLPDAAFDLHVSCRALQCIEERPLARVISEGVRVLKPGGAMVHFIRTCDSFSQADPDIIAVNFLRFSREEWARHGGNRFAFCNRLRGPQYLRLFQEAGLEVIRAEAIVDERSLTELRRGFPVAREFRGFTHEENACVEFRVMCRKRGRG